MKVEGLIWEEEGIGGNEDKTKGGKRVKMIKTLYTYIINIC